MRPELVPDDVMPAHLLLFDGDLRIDEAQIHPPIQCILDAEKEGIRRLATGAWLGSGYPQLGARR